LKKRCYWGGFFPIIFFILSSGRKVKELAESLSVVLSHED